jgi:arylformamidase
MGRAAPFTANPACYHFPLARAAALMKLFDVSHRLSEALPTYPGNAPYQLDAVKRLADGDSANVSLLHVGTHTGTHVDAPSHFIPGGTSVDELPLDLLVGPARVIEIPGRRGIGRQELIEALQPGDERVLIKTGNAVLWGSSAFDPEYAHVTGDGAQYLVEAGVRVVGVDYLSVEGFHAPGAPAHHALLGAGVLIIEGLKLDDVAPGVYELICLPLPVEGADGAPARVLLRLP